MAKNSIVANCGACDCSLCGSFDSTHCPTTQVSSSPSKAATDIARQQDALFPSHPLDCIQPLHGLSAAGCVPGPQQQCRSRSQDWRSALRIGLCGHTRVPPGAHPSSKERTASDPAPIGSSDHRQAFFRLVTGCVVPLRSFLTEPAGLPAMWCPVLPEIDLIVRTRNYSKGQRRYSPT